MRPQQREVNSASHSTVSARAAIAVLTAARLTPARRKCSASTMLTSTMSSSGYARERAIRAVLGPSIAAVRASARLHDRVSSEPPISQVSSARHTQPALVTGRLASTSSPMIAGGANIRKQKSAAEVCGTGRRSTTSYQPQMPLPKAVIAEEQENSSQARRCGPAARRAYSSAETAAAAAAAASPKSPMIRAASWLPQPSEAPVV